MLTVWLSERGCGSWPTTDGVTGVAAATEAWSEWDRDFRVSGAGTGAGNCWTVATVSGEPPPKT